jgi:hypothetical protein
MVACITTRDGGGSDTGRPVLGGGGGRTRPLGPPQLQSDSATAETTTDHRNQDLDRRTGTPSGRKKRRA